MFTFGADPELFVKKGDTFLSGYGLIPGDKENPFPVECGAVQVDGMALEFNIDPAEDEEKFVYNLETVLQHLRNMVPDYELVPTPVAEFDREYLEAQPDEAKMLGCNPDHNGWTGDENRTPDGSVSFRTGSGHIHIGWTTGADVDDAEHRAMAFAMVRQLDFYLGLPSLFFDEDKKRRELYGKAGACRVKPYGVEYRVLSNTWLRSQEMMRWVFRSAMEGATALASGKNLVETYGDIQDIINSSDKERASVILRDSGILVPV